MFNLQIHPLRKDKIEYVKFIAWLQEDPKHIKEEIKRCSVDPWYFITGWIKTKYEKGIGQFDARRFPIRNYFIFIIWTWLIEPLLAIVKSRQLMMSWLFCSLYLWDVMFHHGRINLLHTLNESKAWALIDRIDFMWNNLPEFLKWDGKSKTKENIKIGITGSEAQGLPMGPDSIRSFAASNLLEDEAQSQKGLREGIGAARPAITGQIQADGSVESGKITLVGTASSGEWQEVLFGKENKNPVLNICAEYFWIDPENEKFRENGTDGIEIPMRGIRTWRTREKFFVIELHYCADINKDPFTENGEKWCKAAGRNTEDWTWMREMGIDFSAGAGTRVFSGFDMNIHCISVQDWKLNPKRTKMESVDFGRNWPAGTIAQFNDDDQFVICAEYLRTDIIVDSFLEGFKQFSDTYYKTVTRQGYCDPHGDDASDMRYEKATEIMAQVFGVWPVWRRSSIDERVLLISRLLKPRAKDGKPSILIVKENCPKTINMFLKGLVRHPKKDNHPSRDHPHIDIFDAIGYNLISVFDDFGNCFPPGEERTITEEDDEYWEEETVPEGIHLGRY